MSIRRRILPRLLATGALLTTCSEDSREKYVGVIDCRMGGSAGEIQDGAGWDDNRQIVNLPEGYLEVSRLILTDLNDGQPRAGEIATVVGGCTAGIPVKRVEDDLETQFPDANFVIDSIVQIRDESGSRRLDGIVVELVNG